MERLMYHTQECRGNHLKGPLICKKPDAWLGTGYYFWYDEKDSHMWGEIFKTKQTGAYDVYNANITCENVLDTVFDEDHYLFWKDLVEYAAREIQKKTGKKVGLKQLNDYFKSIDAWSSVAGILFQDLPMKHQVGLVKGLHYRKRIQIAVFDTSIISNFAHFYRSK